MDSTAVAYHLQKVHTSRENYEENISENYLVAQGNSLPMSSGDIKKKTRMVT